LYFGVYEWWGDTDIVEEHLIGVLECEGLLAGSVVSFHQFDAVLVIAKEDVIYFERPQFMQSEIGPRLVFVIR